MERATSRRELIKSIGAATVLAGTGMTVEASSAVSGRFIVDTRSADSDKWRDEVTVERELRAIDLAVVTGSESALDGLDIRFMKDVQFEVSPPDPVDADVDTKLDASEVEAQATAESETTVPPYPLQWDKRAQNVSTVHGNGFTGEGATIAIIDSGVYGAEGGPGHPDLQNLNVEKSRNYSERSPDSIDGYHGTHVAGIAAATGDSATDGGPWVVGMAPDAELISMQVFPEGFFSYILSAVTDSATLGADVANLSLGAYPFPPSVNRDLAFDLQGRAVEYAHEQGMLLVAAAGNDDTNLDTDDEGSPNIPAGSKNLPTEVPGYMTVSATGPVTTDPLPFGNVAPTHMPAYYTNYGKKALDVSAAGGNTLTSNFDAVLSTFPPNTPGGFTRIGDGAYGTIHGTSMACPQTAGLAALVKAANPGAAPQQVRRHIENTARQIETTYPDVFDLFGISIGYFNSERPGILNDFELEDEYTSPRYRGEGHINTVGALSKNIPDALEGGIEVMGETLYPADPDDDGLYEDVRGDSPNSVEDVDMADVEALYNIALRGLVSSGAFEAGTGFDFNGDGVFDMRDVQHLLRQVDGSADAGPQP